MKKFLCIAFFLIFSITLADDSPVNQNDGAYGPMVYPLSLKKKSKIRMEKENLLFRFNLSTTWVTATFYFRNTDQQHSVTQLTGFPDIALGIAKSRQEGRMTEPYSSNAYVGTTYSPISHLETSIDGVKVDSKLEYGFVSNENWAPGTRNTGDQVAWYVVNLIIPPGGLRVLERHYVCRNVASVPCRSFTYITHTGGGWYGTIGELSADVIIGNDVNADELDFEPQDGWRPTDKYNTLHLIWKNFDPRKDKTKQQIQITDCPHKE